MLFSESRNDSSSSSVRKVSTILIIVSICVLVGLATNGASTLPSLRSAFQFQRTSKPSDAGARVSSDNAVPVTPGSLLVDSRGNPTYTAAAAVNVNPVYPDAGNGVHVFMHSAPTGFEFKTASGFVTEDMVRFSSFTDMKKHKVLSRRTVRNERGDVLESQTISISPDIIEAAATNTDPTVSDAIRYVQTHATSASVDMMKVHLADVQAGCAFQDEGRSSFNLRIRDRLNGHDYYSYRRVQILKMVGCDESRVNPIYAEFKDDDAGEQNPDASGRGISIVKCPSVPEGNDVLCDVHQVISTLEIVQAFNGLKEAAGNKPLRELIPMNETKLTVGNESVHVVVETDFDSTTVRDYTIYIGIGAIIGVIAGAIIGGAIGGLIGVMGGPGGVPMGFMAGAAWGAGVGWKFGVAAGAAAGGIVKAAGGCFPATSMITTPTGIKFISQVGTGDVVLSFDAAHGKFAWTTIYMQGHAENYVLAPFYSIKTASYEISASKLHFIPLLGVGNGDKLCESFGHANASWNTLEIVDSASIDKCVTMTRAYKVNVGDWVLVRGTSHVVQAERILSTSVKVMRGLFNPYTMNGRLVVNGVVVSVHSDWLLESLFGVDLLSVFDKYIPQIYQMVFGPMRWIYEWCPDCLKKLAARYPAGLNDCTIFDVIKALLSFAFASN